MLSKSFLYSDVASKALSIIFTMNSSLFSRKSWRKIMPLRIRFVPIDVSKNTLASSRALASVKKGSHVAAASTSPEKNAFAVSSGVARRTMSFLICSFSSFVRSELLTSHITSVWDSENLGAATFLPTRSDTFTISDLEMIPSAPFE